MSVRNRNRSVVAKRSKTWSVIVSRSVRNSGRLNIIDGR